MADTRGLTVAIDGQLREALTAATQDRDRLRAALDVARDTWRTRCQALEVERDLLLAALRELYKAFGGLVSVTAPGGVVAPFVQILREHGIDPATLEADE